MRLRTTVREGEPVPDYDRKSILVLVLLCFFLLPIQIGPRQTDIERAFANFVRLFNESIPEGYKREFFIRNDSIQLTEEFYADDNRSNSLYDITGDNLTNALLESAPPSFKSLQILKTSLPARIDWREHGIITSVRTQGECGSCYAHSVISNIESAVAWLDLNARNESNPIPTREFSIQQMVDCAKNFNAGCSGGDTCDLLEWLKKEQVEIVPKELYPMAKEQEKCKIKKVLDNVPESFVKVQVEDYTCSNYTGFEHEMLNLLAHQGPLIAAVHGLQWRNYIRGVISQSCDGPPNHAVQIVGYDLTGPEPFYIVRNSWGRRFGINGYAKVAIGRNVCQIASRVSTVKVALS